MRPQPLVVLSLLVLMFAFASPARATCPGGVVLPFNDVLGGYLQGCADARPVAGFLFALSSGTAPDTFCPTGTSCNSAQVDFVCETGGALNGQGGPCQSEAGVAGDGNITVLFDWGGSGAFPAVPIPFRGQGSGGTTPSS